MITLEKTKFQKMKTANVVAVIITVSCFLFLAALLFVEIPNSNRDIVNFLAGSVFTTGFGGVVYFLYDFKKNTDEEESKINDFSDNEVNITKRCDECLNDKN